MLLGDLESGAAADALSEDDLGDVENWIDAGDLLYFFADELYGGLIRKYENIYPFGGCDKLLTSCDLRAAATAFLEISAVTTFAAYLVISTLIVLNSADSTLSTSSVIAPVIDAALRRHMLWGLVRMLSGRLEFCASPRGAERKFS